MKYACDRCQGFGLLYDRNGDEYECPECDGWGYVESGGEPP